jgi:hypothetical protein
MNDVREPVLESRQQLLVRESPFAREDRNLLSGRHSEAPEESTFVRS